MTTTEEIICWLRQWKADAPSTLDAETPLIATGLLDSLDLLELIDFVENRFGIQFGDDDMHPDNFHNVAAVEALVARKRAA